MTDIPAASCGTADPPTLLAVAEDAAARARLAALGVAAGARARIVLCADAGAALTAAAAAPPAAILAALTGSVPQHRIARLAGRQPAPVIVLLPQSSEVQEAACLASGAADVVAGDLPPAQLIELVLHAARRARLAPRARTPLLLAQEAAEGLLVLTREGRVRFINAAGAALLGVTAEALLGQPFPFAVSPGEPTALSLAGRALEMHVIEADWGGVPALVATLGEVLASGRGAEPERIAASGALRTRLTSIIGFSELMLAGAYGPIANDRYARYLSDIRSTGLDLLAEAEASAA